MLCFIALYVSVSHKETSQISLALKAAGLSVTAQRLAVYQVVDQHAHATPEQILEGVQLVIGTISRQAVYDALHRMCEHGLLRCIQPAKSTARYETRVDNHHHLTCRSCGELVDVDCAKGSAPCMEPIDSHGYEIDEAEVIYWGVCPDCQR